MPQVSGRALSESLGRAVEAQSRVANAAREAAAQAARDRAAGASTNPERDLEDGSTKVPAPPGTSQVADG